MFRTATIAHIFLYSLVILLCVVATASPCLAAGSVLSRGSVGSNSAGSDISMRSETLKRMDDIKAALEKFTRANKVLPCPTTSTSTASTLGTAVSTTTPTTACAGDSAGTTTNANIVEGMVPVRTLNLPMDYAYDAWGRRILYVIDRRFAHKGDTAQGLGALTSSATETSSYGNTRTGDIAVYDRVGAGRQRADGSIGPVALLISYGPNGYGGYPKNGQRISYLSASLDERANISTSSTSVTTDYIKAPASATFDDIVYLIPRLQDVPFLCPDRGTGFNAYGNTPAGPGYPAYSWADPAMTLSLSNPADRLFYKACMGTTVNATTGAITCNGAVCYSGRLQRTCKISTDTNKTYASWNTSGIENTPLCQCPAQTSAAGNFWYSNRTWAAQTPPTQGAAGTLVQVACNPAFYDGMINRYCRGDDSTGLSGGWSKDANLITGTNKSLLADVSSLTKNCTCKAKSVSAGVGYNAFTIPAGTAVGSAYNKTCDASGYTGTVNFTCNADNGYATSATGCIQGCSAITGYSSGNQYANWATTPINTNNVAGSCAAGLVPSAGGRPSRNCQAGSVWGGTITGSCQCPTYTPGTGYSGSTGQANVTGTADVNCASGYYNTANSNKGRFQCNSNGTWTVVQSCERPCNVTDSSRNSTAAGSYSGNNIFAINWGNDGDTPRGATKRVYGVPSAAYSGRMRSVCSAGWKVGYAERTCQANGTWATPTSTCNSYVQYDRGDRSGSAFQQATHSRTVPEGCYNVFAQVWGAGAGSYGISGAGFSGQAGSMGHIGVWTQYGWPSNTRVTNTFSIAVGHGGPDDPGDDQNGGGSSFFNYSRYSDRFNAGGGSRRNEGGGAYVDSSRGFWQNGDVVNASGDEIVIPGSINMAWGGGGQIDNNGGGGEEGGRSNPQWIPELNTNIGGENQADGGCDWRGTYETLVGAGACCIKRTSGSFYDKGLGGAVVIRCNRDVN